MTESFKLGQFVELNDGRTATIRFIGQTLFQVGEWLGVEFDDAVGKNDGTVQGERYFECKAGHGMFIRPAVVGKILEEPTPKPRPPAKMSFTATKVRPSILPNGARRSTTIDPTAARRRTLNATSPTPSARVQSTATGQGSTFKLIDESSTSASSSSNASSRGATPPTSDRGPPAIAAAISKTDLPPPNGKNASVHSSATSRPRPSLAGPNAGSRRAAGAAGRPRLGQSSRSTDFGGYNPLTMPSVTDQLQKEDSQDSLPSAGEDEASSVDLAPLRDDLHGESESSKVSDSSVNGQAPSEGVSERPNALSPKLQARAEPHVSATSRQIEELEMKIRTFEKRRLEDREKLKKLERLQAERDRFEGIIQRLQTKMQPQQQELIELKRQLKESEKTLNEAQTLQADHDTNLEMAALDREMAEETADVLRTELDALKQKTEELELEVEVLREENQEFNKEMSTEEKTSQGWLQMERSNERLREALLRLRDMTQSQEAEMKDQIASLQEDLRQLGGIQEQYEKTKEKLRQSEMAIEDLKQQLDAALGAEDLIEELTEKNLTLTEQVDDLKLNINDLENLKELNDELELNHVEAEKQMQEEIDYKETVLAEQSRRTAMQDEKLADYEYTIARFRELVVNLQSHIEDMQTTQHMSKAECEELHTRSRAMLDLNLKLQDSAAKTQIKTIDLELRSLEAQEAAEHLMIVQMFLPDGFKAERDSVMAYLRFKRVASKARLLHQSLKETVSDNRVMTEDVFTLCDIMDKLVWISAMCDRFVNSVAGSSLERFAMFEGALYELEPVERTMNAYIEAWKKGELREGIVAEELQRSTALLSHLAEIHIQPENVERYADDVLMRTKLMQSYLENTATALLCTKAMVSGGSESIQQGEDDGLAEFARKADNISLQSRSAKVIVGKVVRSLEELKAHSKSTSTDSLGAFKQCQNLTSSIATAAREFGRHLRHAIAENEDEGASVSFALQSALSKLGSTVFADSESLDPLATFSIRLRTVIDQLTSLLALTSNLSQSTEFERSPPPWILRSQALKSSKLTSMSTEEELKRLQDAMQERSMQLRLRDQTLEEQSIKIELFESRARDATAKANKIAELQLLVDAGKDREKKLVAAIQTQLSSARTLQEERDTWKRIADERQPPRDDDAESAAQTRVRALAAARQVESLQAEVQGLQGAVRYLRRDDRRAGFPRHDKKNMAWLDEPLLHKRGKDQERSDKIGKDGRDVFAALLELVANAEMVDLRRLPENKLAWRPAREKASWWVLRQREEWERWCARRTEVVRRGLEVQGKVVADMAPLGP